MSSRTRKPPRKLHYPNEPGNARVFRKTLCLLQSQRRRLCHSNLFITRRDYRPVTLMSSELDLLDRHCGSGHLLASALANKNVPFARIRTSPLRESSRPHLSYPPFSSPVTRLFAFNRERAQ